MVSADDLPFVEYNITVTVQSVISEFMEENRMAEIKRMMGLSARIFKLESNVEMTIKKALNPYNGIVIVYPTFSSFKQITAKSMRVWRKESVIESPVLSSLTEALLSMASGR